MIERRESRMNESELREAFEAHKDAVYRFSWRMTNSSSAAEDIAQDVFVLLLRERDRFDASRGELRSFLIGVARNLARKWLRGEHRWNTLDEEQLVVEPLDIENREMAEVVATAVQSLPPLQREVLLLAHYEGFSLDEIARTIEVEVGAVKARLYRARQNLKRMLAPLQQPDGRVSYRNGTAQG
jgi:RNA polymerase sigma-70 factor (ECF subfamily)